jgi:hypothetical protein
MAANGATSTAPTLKKTSVVVLGGTFVSRYCSLTTKLEIAPLAAAPTHDQAYGLEAVYRGAAVEARGEDRYEHRGRGE